MMKQTWPTSINERFLQITEKEMQEGCRLICLLAVVLFPVFGFVDYTTQYNFFTELTVIRIITSCFFFIVHALFFLGKLRQSVNTSLLLLAIATVSITLMCLVTGGFASSYYGGINLIILAAVLIFPGNPTKILKAVAIILSIYLMGMISGGNLKEQVPSIINNLAFILSTVVIGLSTAMMSERFRKQSFMRFVELDKTKELLQGELIGHQGNIETLTRELIDRKIELERAIAMMTAAKEETNEALRLREEFISLASHELKTPLTSLKLQTQIAIRKIQATENNVLNTTKILETFDYQVKRLTRMVEDMLDISRIKSGKLELERTTVDLTVLVENLVNRFKEQFEEKGIHINFNSTEDVKGNWDGFRIEQVILNLLTNAVKYGEGMPIDISVRQKGESAFIVVKDYGIGIPRASQTKIFKRFERAVSPMEYSGLGLGLYISEKIVAAHSGNIFLESEPGRGSIFTVRLPFKKENEDIDSLIEELTMPRIPASI